MKCNVCACNIRQTNYELHYLGTVCSKCFRMSKKNYCELVEIISILKVKYIFDEILIDLIFQCVQFTNKK